MIYFRFLDIPAYLIAYIIISFFGLSIGSFLNVCIYRLPHQKQDCRLDWSPFLQNSPLLNPVPAWAAHREGKEIVI